jgi:hypothetical protein
MALQKFSFAERMIPLGSNFDDGKRPVEGFEHSFGACPGRDINIEHAKSLPERRDCPRVLSICLKGKFRTETGMNVRRHALDPGLHVAQSTRHGVKNDRGKLIASLRREGAFKIRVPATIQSAGECWRPMTDDDQIMSRPHRQRRQKQRPDPAPKG